MATSFLFQAHSMRASPQGNSPVQTVLTSCQPLLPTPAPGCPVPQGICQHFLVLLGARPCTGSLCQPRAAPLPTLLPSTQLLAGDVHTWQCTLALAEDPLPSQALELGAGEDSDSRYTCTASVPSPT